MKEELIIEIKELIKSDKNDSFEINPIYLDYFSLEELEDIKANLIYKKVNFREINSTYLDEIYQKTKEDKI